MLLEFIAAIVIAVGAGGAAHMAVKLSRERLPGWLTPAAAGAAMVGFVVWSEYSWVERAKSALPPEVAVVSQNAITSWFRPWTYVWPLTNRMILIDGRFDRRNEAFPELLITAVVMMGRWDPGRQIPVVFDCARGLRAELSADVVITEDGTLEGADWLQLAADDPMLRAACDRTSARLAGAPAGA
jgi:hypothetical protein